MVTLGILTIVNGHPCDSDTNLIVRGLYGTMLWPLGFKVKQMLHNFKMDLIGYTGNELHVYRYNAYNYN